MYYAAVSGSVTNTVSKKFFDKYYKLEIERIPFLKKYGLMDVYIQERLSFYVRKWYMPRLERVSEKGYPEAVHRFLDIIDLYEQFNPVYEVEVEEFLKELRKKYINNQLEKGRIIMKEYNIEDLTLEDLKSCNGEVLKIYQGDTDFYYKVHLKENNDKLIVFSNGAVDPKKATPPVFMRSKWYES